VRTFSSDIDEDDRECIFVLAGAVHLDELISSANRNSPLNTTRPIYMRSLDPDRFLKLTGNLRRAGVEMEESCMELMYQYTGGHVNLTQKVCLRSLELQKPYLDKRQVQDVLDGFIRSGDENLRHILKELARRPLVRE